MKPGIVFIFQLAALVSWAQSGQQPYVSRDTVSFKKDLYIKDTPDKYLKSHALWKSVKAPLALTALSLYSFTDNENLSKFEVKEERDEWVPHFRHHADDYLQYAPIAAVYGLNLMGGKGKHDLANRTALLIKTEILVAAITFPLKRITAVPRPDTGAPTSFPSGHTAQAFAAATFMAKEYNHVSKWYGVGAYTLATGIGVMRILNNRHWVSDVLAGAAVGILSTNLVYLTHRYKWGNNKRTNHQTLVMPSYDGRTGMISVVHIMH
jgi:membrane-associated phospholipid phosphatase